MDAKTNDQKLEFFLPKAGISIIRITTIAEGMTKIIDKRYSNIMSFLSKVSYRV